ncbi:NEL-type E3 ubiquitin ligase domain-containing protein [Pseudomonas sp. CHM02]|uniref:NEL-type E3 ubiquitin ligase domain-containing protein n=1 Tax=Pseudomonas sp. CHM02 TaxID=1463662 RepID=UPI000471DF98|nr:NEL-type E3 ubiquitin ligase domain-containing protein [Pseudomonas sp. CHM02]
MAAPQDSNQTVKPVAQADITAALLEITGDLDKAQVLQDRLPAWWLSTDAATRDALQQAHEDSQRPHEAAARLLGRVKPLKVFCAERLKTFLSAKGHASLNVERDTLDVPRRYLELNASAGPVIEVIKTQKHSLLQAAMQNFEQALAEPGGMPAGSVIRSGHTVVQGLSAETFAGYCRELDLGSAYQQHLQAVFNLRAPGESTEAEHAYNPAVSTLGQSRRMDMQTDLHIAYAKGDISQPTYTVLLALIRANAPADQMQHLLFHGKPLVWQGLNIGETCVWGVMVLAHAATEGFSSGPVVLYMPNEPVRPWYEYPSLDDFKQYLTLKLQVQSYRRFFTGYLDESERFGFFQRFDPHRTLGRMEPVAETGNLSSFFFNVCTGKLLLDAHVLAVPTAQADEDALQQRLQNYLHAGLNVLNIAGFLVPAVGLLMTGVGIGQLLGEVFEGIDDWNHNEKTEALGHLVNVAEGIAGLALFAAGAKTLGAATRLVTRPADFFDGMEAVKGPDSPVKLGQRRSTAYRQSPDVIAGAAADNAGVYKVHGRSYAKIDGGVYSIAFDADARQWMALHPQRSGAYRLPLEHNRMGGWRFAWERPEDWGNLAYIINRLHPVLGAFSDERLKEIACIADLSLPELRYRAQENLPLPERFRDWVLRFIQEQKVRDLTWQLEHQAQVDASTARTLMYALPHMPGWPTGRFFEVLDSQDNLLESYPITSPFDYEDLSIHITEQQLADGKVMPALLEALDAEETQALLGGVVAPGQAEATLARRLLASLQRSHRPVYEQLYRDADVIEPGDHDALKSHYPKLPGRLAWELLSNTPTAQRVRLRETGRVPLVLAQQARETLQILEEDQALSGLYWPRQATEATLRLAIGLLARVPGWPQAMSLHVRRDALMGELISQLGAPDAALRRTVVASAGGYQAFDGQGKALGALATGDDSFYQALTDTLTADQKATLKVTGAQRSSFLLHELQAAAESERSTLARYLWPERPPPKPALACIQAVLEEPPKLPAALLRKGRTLYPRLDAGQLARLLHDLGPDHVSRATAVKKLEGQLKLLQQTLKQWSGDKAAVRGMTTSAKRDFREARHWVVKAIERSWKRKTLLSDESGAQIPGLKLDGMLAGPLPSLPAEVDFGHVRELSLKHMALSNEVTRFLEHFKGLNTLDLAHNKLTELPHALTHMPGLQRLYLNDNQLQLTASSRETLGGLTELQVLNLRNNPLLNAPTVSRMLDLRLLFLDNCMLQELPAGLRRPPYLERVSLRSNPIRELPQWLSTVSRDVAQALDLAGNNSLSTASKQLLRDYRARIGIGMGFLEDDIARMTEQKARELWLKDVGTLLTTRQATWNALRAEPGSDGLFTLLAELGGVADTKKVREDMSRRVWWVLNAAEADAGLRKEVFERAATPLNCDDAAAVSFSNLEVLTHVHEASIAIEGAQLSAEKLLHLSKGLFRLDRLERYAQSHSEAHPSADPLEVSLAFRKGLADLFYLPGQPRHMRFESLGQVAPHHLTAAADRLRTAELSPELLNYLVELPLWTRYLKKAYSTPFERLAAPFEARMQAVFERGETLTDGEYRSQMNVIVQARAQAESAEIRRRTMEMLKPGATAGCSVPLL